MTSRAGTLATAADLIDVEALIADYYDLQPDPAIAEQRVVFGTSGHRGSSSKRTFNERHILAITQAIVDYRAEHGPHGPLFMGADTHALSAPALSSALRVLLAAGIDVRIDSALSPVPTPALSLAILEYNAAHPEGPHADGIIITPSHNPPTDGGFKYNPAHGGPAGSEATTAIAEQANAYLEADLAGVELTAAVDLTAVPSGVSTHDFRDQYVSALESIIDLAAIRSAGIRIGADPLGGASVHYWEEIARRYNLDLTVVNPVIDPRWSFMTLDWDEKIRMDPSSPSAMASVLARQQDFDILTGNDADSDRHGIVTPDGGLMNPNHFLAVSIDYLYRARTLWPAEAAIGKTLVSSSMIDRVAADLGRRLVEVPVGFKWFVPGLLSGEIAFGGEESAGASFLRTDGSVWTTDKDGIILALLASEILAVTGKTPSQRYRELTAIHGDPVYQRVDAAATGAQKAALAKLDPAQVTATELAGEPIIAALSHAPGNGAAIGGLKVVTENAWFAARPSGTEDVYKIYAESFRGAEHLAQVQEEARAIVAAALGEA